MNETKSIIFLREKWEKFLECDVKWHLVLITGITVLLFIAEFIAHGSVMRLDADTQSYYWDGESVMNGIFPFLRTPVYPALLYGLVSIFGKFGIYALSLVQLAALLTAEICIYKAVRIATKKAWISLACAIAFGWRFKTVLLTMIVMTESLAISAVAILIYFIVKAVTAEDSWKYCIAIGLLTALMLMLRPFFICLTPAVAVTLIYCAWKGNGRARTAAAVAAVLAIAPYIGYCAIFKSNYGVFTTSSVGVSNTASSLHDMDQSLPLDYDWEHDFQKINAQNGKIVHERFGEYAKMKLSLFSNSAFGTYKYFPEWNKYPLNDNDRFEPKMLLLTLLTIAYMWLTIMDMKRKEWDVATVRTAIAISAVAITFTAFVGAESQFSRIMMPSYPVAIAMMAGLLKEMTCKKKSRDDKPDRADAVR
ncbi:MAG: hypothetical protein LKF31_00480 [Muribaculaceae bacterium]|jgi:hypothetical protein|nr:hypothetical protein [Muribaculaceae bacterium]